MPIESTISLARWAYKHELLSILEREYLNDKRCLVWINQGLGDQLIFLEIPRFIGSDCCRCRCSMRRSVDYSFQCDLSPDTFPFGERPGRHSLEINFR